MSAQPLETPPWVGVAGVVRQGEAETACIVERIDRDAQAGLCVGIRVTTPVRLEAGTDVVLEVAIDDAFHRLNAKIDAGNEGPSRFLLSASQPPYQLHRRHFVRVAPAVNTTYWSVPEPRPSSRIAATFAAF